MTHSSLAVGVLVVILSLSQCLVNISRTNVSHDRKLICHTTSRALHQREAKSKPLLVTLCGRNQSFQRSDSGNNLIFVSLRSSVNNRFSNYDSV